MVMFQIFKRSFLFFVSIFAMLLSLALANLFQCIIVILFYFVSKKILTKLATKIAVFWWSFAVFWSEKILKLEYSVDSPIHELQSDSVILICNHQSFVDVLGILWIAQKSKSLHKTKWIAKSSLKWVPGLGWGLWALDAVFVNRSWQKDQHKMDQLLQKFKKEKPFWLILFPEGTRYSFKKNQEAREFAKKKNLKWTPEKTLFPRSKGFVSMALSLTERSPLWIDLSIGFASNHKSVLDLFMGRIKKIYLHIEVTESKNIPKNESTYEAWLIESFEKKDQWLKNLL